MEESLTDMVSLMRRLLRAIGSGALQMGWRKNDGGTLQCLI